MSDIGTNITFQKQLGLNFDIDQKYVGLKMKDNNILSFNYFKLFIYIRFYAFYNKLTQSSFHFHLQTYQQESRLWLKILQSETLLYSTLFGRQVVARVVPDTEKTVGDEAEFHVHWNRIHVFDKDTERNIL